MLSVGSTLKVKGFITDEKFLRGQSLSEIEKRLGFHKGRLKNGATFCLVDYPHINAFSFRGYSQVAGHHYDEQYSEVKVDVVRAKKSLIKSWKERGVQLIKVLPEIRHNSTISDDEQYPPGSGIPQWEITHETKARVIAILESNAYKDNSPFQRMQYLHNQ